MISAVVTGKLDVREAELPETDGAEAPPGVEETSLPVFDAAFGEPYGIP